MAIQFPDFQRISFNEANPWLVGAERGQQMGQNLMQFPQDLQAKILANQIAQVQANYAEPLSKASLEKAQLYNQWYGKDIASQIGLRGAQGSHLGAETKRINTLLPQELQAKMLSNQLGKRQMDYPGLMGGDTTKNLEALRMMGLVGDNYQPIQNQNDKNSLSHSENSTPNYSGGFTPISGNEKTQQYDQAQDISNSVVRQQQNMGIPYSQTNTNPTQGFNVNNLVEALINKPMTDLQYKQTLTKVMQQNLAGKAYTSMPSVEKEYAISQARAFGYTGEQASRMFNQGYDLSSMAQSKGYDGSDPSSWPIARGAPTTAIQTRIQRANSTMAALDAVEPAISSAYANYASRFHGIAPGLIKDMLTGENPDQQAEAFAAYSLYPELQALRINAQGGNVGQGAIQHMADASFSRLNTLGLSPNSFVYQKAMKRVNQLIKQMNRAENSAIYKQGNDQFDKDDKSNYQNEKYDFSKMSDDELIRIIGEK